MKNKHYKDAIEALGMMVKRTTIINKLNKIYAHADDEKLRYMTKQVIEDLRRTDSNTELKPAIDMKNAVPSAKSLMHYCQFIAYQENNH